MSIEAENRSSGCLEASPTLSPTVLPCSHSGLPHAFHSKDILGGDVSSPLDWGRFILTSLAGGIPMVKMNRQEGMEKISNRTRKEGKSLFAFWKGLTYSQM